MNFKDYLIYKFVTNVFFLLTFLPTIVESYDVCLIQPADNPIIFTKSNPNLNNPVDKYRSKPI